MSASLVALPNHATCSVLCILCVCRGGDVSYAPRQSRDSSERAPGTTCAGLTHGRSQVLGGVAVAPGCSLPGGELGN